MAPGVRVKAPNGSEDFCFGTPQGGAPLEPFDQSIQIVPSPLAGVELRLGDRILRIPRRRKGCLSHVDDRRPEMSRGVFELCQ